MLVARNMKQLAYIWLQFPLPLSYFSSYRIFISTGNSFFILRIPHRFFFSKYKKIYFYRLFIFILSSDVTMLASLILKQGVQGLLAFAFSILTVNDENTKQT